MAAPAANIAPAAPAAPPAPVTLTHKQVLNIRLRHFPNGAAMIDAMQKAATFDEKNDSWNLLQRDTNQWLIAAVKHAADCPANERVRAPIQRVLVPSGNCMVEIPLPGDWNDALQCYDIKFAYLRVSKLRAMWDAFADAFVQEMNGMLKGITAATAAQIIKDMLVINIEPNRSYVEFAIYTTLM